MGVIPAFRNLIPEHLRLENVDPILLWIHEQPKKEEGTPTAGTAAIHATTEKVAEGTIIRKGIPGTINIPNQPPVPTTGEFRQLDGTNVVTDSSVIQFHERNNE
jgi:hypothetical protein